MSRIVLIPLGIREVVPLALVLVLVFGWSPAAHAQTAADAQYESPTATASGNPAASADPASSGKSARATGDVVKAESGDPAVSADPAFSGKSARVTGDTFRATVLPSTGGAPLPLVTLGILALGATGLLVLRQTGRR